MTKNESKTPESLSSEAVRAAADAAYTAAMRITASHATRTLK